MDSLPTSSNVLFSLEMSVVLIQFNLIYYIFIFVLPMSSVHFIVRRSTARSTCYGFRIDFTLVIIFRNSFVPPKSCHISYLFYSSVRLTWAAVESLLLTVGLTWRREPHRSCKSHAHRVYQNFQVCHVADSFSITALYLFCVLSQF